MPLPSDTDSETDIAWTALRQSIMTAFCDVLHTSKLPPMTVMSLAAAAVGSVYNEVAAHHRGADACPCGWVPSPRADVETLQDALAGTTRPAPIADLRMARAAGRA